MRAGYGYGTGKGVPGMDRFGSKVSRMHMEVARALFLTL